MIESNIFICGCGKEFKTVTGFEKHRSACVYSNIDLNKIYMLGNMINECGKKLFQAPLGKIKKYAKENQITFADAQKKLHNDEIYKYRKSLWDILKIWNAELLPSEYRHFLIWAFNTYKEITLLSLRNTLGNTKIIYRYNIENTTKNIGKRINDSLIHIHEHGNFSNDFEFVDALSSGNVSIYYVLFNDWLAQNWFGRLDQDLQKELEDNVKLASKIILDRLNKDEFNLLQKLACSSTPVIYCMK